MIIRIISNNILDYQEQNLALNTILTYQKEPLDNLNLDIGNVECENTNIDKDIVDKTTNLNNLKTSNSKMIEAKSLLLRDIEANKKQILAFKQRITNFENLKSDLLANIGQLNIERDIIKSNIQISVLLTSQSEVQANTDSLILSQTILQSKDEELKADRLKIIERLEVNNDKLQEILNYINDLEDASTIRLEPKLKVSLKLLIATNADEIKNTKKFMDNFKSEENNIIKEINQLSVIREDIIESFGNFDKDRRTIIRTINNISQITDIDNEISTLETSIIEASNGITKLQSELEDFEDKNKSNDQENTKLEQNISINKEKISSLESKIHELKLTKGKSLDSLAELEFELTNTQKIIQTTQEDISYNLSRIDSLTTQRVANTDFYSNIGYGEIVNTPVSNNLTGRLEARFNILDEIDIKSDDAHSQQWTS